MLLQSVKLPHRDLPAKAVSGLSSLRANQMTSFFLVSGFGSGVYSAKLLKGTRHRFSGFNQPRQVRYRCCGSPAPDSRETRPA
jgi:hypothetical protein